MKIYSHKWEHRLIVQYNGKSYQINNYPSLISAHDNIYIIKSDIIEQVLYYFYSEITATHLLQRVLENYLTNRVF